MSAYVVDNETIDKVVSFLEADARGANKLYYWQAGRGPVAELGYNLPADAGRLAAEMFALNVNAVEQRYGEGQASEFRPLDYEYHFRMPSPRVHTLKAMQCWLYQCAEGDVPETSKLYKAFREIEGDLALAIVRDLPEYEKANWG